MQVIKRDGRKVEFDSSKIESAIKKATHKTGEDINEEFILSILDFIKNQNKNFTVEQIQDMCSMWELSRDCQGRILKAQKADKKAHPVKD